MVAERRHRRHGTSLGRRTRLRGSYDAAVGASGQVPAPLPMVVPPMFRDPEVAAQIEPLLQQMQRHSEEEAAEAEAYRRIEEEEERQFLEWMNTIE